MHEPFFPTTESEIEGLKHERECRTKWTDVENRLLQEKGLAHALQAEVDSLAREGQVGKEDSERWKDMYDKSHIGYSEAAAQATRTEQEAKDAKSECARLQGSHEESGGRAR